MVTDRITTRVRFFADQIDFMRRNLAKREDSFGRLVPWDDANYGLDVHWVRCRPYEQTAEPGESLTIDVVITNHSAEARTATCQAVAPRGWRAHGSATVVVPARSDAAATIRVTVPAASPPGLVVIPIRIEYAGRSLGSIREALVQVMAATTAPTVRHA